MQRWKALSQLEMDFGPKKSKRGSPSWDRTLRKPIGLPDDLQNENCNKLLGLPILSHPCVGAGFWPTSVETCRTLAIQAALSMALVAAFFRGS